MIKVREKVASFLGITVTLCFFSLATLTQAAEGNPAGPCMPPHDAADVAGVKNGDSNTQTYQAPAGRTVTRICAASTWSSGKVDHSSYYKDSSSSCYTVSGLGTNQVTVKRVAESYDVPSWQTGPEAGKCHPLTHLDIFLNTVTASPTPASSPSSSSSTTSTDSPSPNTQEARPTPAPSSTPASSNKMQVGTNAASDEETIPSTHNQPETLGAVEEVSSNDSGQNSDDQTVQRWLIDWWWLICLGAAGIVITLWLRSKNR